MYFGLAAIAVPFARGPAPPPSLAIFLERLPDHLQVASGAGCLGMKNRRRSVVDAGRPGYAILAERRREPRHACRRHLAQLKRALP